MRLLIVVCWFLLASTASAAQLAEYTFPTLAYSAPGTHQANAFPCDGTQRDAGFALDYNNPTYIRDVEILLTGVSPGQYGTVTLAPAVPPGAQATIITGVTGNETSKSKSFGVNGFFLPVGQALALEWSCSGGGTRTIQMTISYTANPGPNP